MTEPQITTRETKRTTVTVPELQALPDTENTVRLEINRLAPLTMSEAEAQAIGQALYHAGGGGRESRS